MYECSEFFYTCQGFIQDFLVGGEEVCGRARTHNTYVLACVQARGVWGMPPPQKIFFLDLLRLLLTQSETKFPAIILMTHRC